MIASRLTRSRNSLVVAALVVGAVGGRVTASSPAPAETVHLLPGQQVLVIADAAPPSSPSATPGTSESAGPTASPSATTAPTATPAPSLAPTLPPTDAYLGFGSITKGGDDQPAVHVTTLADTGSGSLREAVAGSNRRIVFDIGGTINLGSQLYVTGSNITIDGSTALTPGITLAGHTLYLQGGVHDIVISNIRHRGGWQGGQDADAITLARGVHAIVLDRLSVSGYFDEAIDLWDNVSDVTISNTIIGPGGDPNHNYANLVGKGSSRASIVNVLYFKTTYRNPAIGWDDATNAAAPGLTADIANILVWGYTATSGNAYGSTVYHGGKANLVDSVFRGGPRAAAAISIETNGQLFGSGNSSLDGKSIAPSNVARFPVPGYASLPAVPASNVVDQIKAGAGAFPRDTTDAGWLSAIPAGG